MNESTDTQQTRQERRVQTNTQTDRRGHANLLKENERNVQRCARLSVSSICVYTVYMYVTARVGFEPATLRTQGTELTSEPPHLTYIEFNDLRSIFLVYW